MGDVSYVITQQTFERAPTIFKKTKYHTHTQTAKEKNKRDKRETNQAGGTLVKLLNLVGLVSQTKI